MVTGISLLVFIAFYLLYSTSKKMAAVGILGIEKWVQDHITTTKYISLALLIISLGLSCFIWGAASGTFTFFVMLMTIASLIVLLGPLRLVNYRLLSFTFIFFIICEIALF